MNAFADINLAFQNFKINLTETQFVVAHKYYPTTTLQMYLFSSYVGGGRK